MADTTPEKPLVTTRARSGGSSTRRGLSGGSSGNSRIISGNLASRGEDVVMGNPGKRPARDNPDDNPDDILQPTVRSRTLPDERSKLKVELNILTAAYSLEGADDPDIKWKLQDEEDFQENEYGEEFISEDIYENNYGKSRTNNFGVVDTKIITEDYTITNDVYDAWSTSNLNKDVTFNPNTETEAIYNIDVKNITSFSNCIRGIGGAIYILRYIQFLDMVHDVCQSRGIDGGNAWAPNGKKTNKIYEVFGDLQKAYIADILWLKNKGIKPFIDAQVGDDRYKEFAIFYSFICVKPITDNTAEFYNLYIEFDNAGLPTFKKKLNNAIPSENFKHLRVQYLLLLFMKITAIRKESVFRGGETSCSSFLENNVNFIRKVINNSESFSGMFINWLNSQNKIILHVDAEKHSGLCGILPKICDFALNKADNKSVEYTKYLSSKEYDAAIVQSSETYVDLLKNSVSSFENKVTTTESTRTRVINLRWESDLIMSFVYKRYEVPNLAPEIFRIIGYIFTSENNLGIQIKRDVKKNYISRKELIYFNYVFEAIKNKATLPLTQQFIAIIPSINITLADLITLTYKNLITYNSKSKIFKSKVIDLVKNETHYNVFINRYKLKDIPTRKAIKLTILQAYSVSVAVANSFGNDIGAINPYAKTVAEEKLFNNQNLSHTSSLRSVTNGAHYDEDHKFVTSCTLMKNKQKNYHNRIWFKHLGDFGQALEFYGYTHIPEKKFSDRVWPIFLSYDKLSAYLSSIFNPLTCLEDLRKNSIAKLQFYTKLNTASIPRTPLETIVLPEAGPSGLFGKVNYGGYNKRIYNRRRYNISKRLKLMTESELKNKLKSVGIKITKNLRGKRKYLTRKELENKALLFNKLQNTAKKIKIKIMYKSRNGLYKYKTYKRLQKEINSKYNKSRKYKKPFVRNFNFG